MINDKMEPSMFDQPMDSDEQEQTNNDGEKVARPTTKPTDRHRKYEKQSYTFWTEKDKEKLSTFPQFTDPSHIAPKKLLADAAKLQDAGIAKKASAWNKTGATW